MNRIYRHVWNKAQGRYIVAAETASSGRGSSRPAVSVGAVFGAMLTVLCVNHAYAQTVVAPGGSTVVYRSANGVQIINIEAANQAGLSHNRYINYNVEQTGTVLNNGNNSQLSRNSQLAGQVLNNPNLSAEARVILNEVVAPNRSTLRGFTEVLGSRADVVLANPWGITCAGCGFINTDRAVLSTGTPQFGPSGNLTEFRTIGGDILIEGAGLDATSTRAIDLVARSIRVDGQINAADLGITVGASQWNYENRNSKVIDAVDKPLYALDSSRLGGMYANRIAIVATENGVGVRMMGDVAASADDFQMDANGRVEMLGRASAARDLRIRQWGTEGVDAFQVVGTGASLTAGKDMHVMASGGLVLTDATIKAESNMLISAQQLIDRAGSQANGARAATGELKLEVAGSAELNNTSWSSQQNLNINTGSLGIGADGATLAAGGNDAAANRVLAVVASAGDIDLSGANVVGAQDVRITAQKGAVRIGTGSSQSVAAGQDLNVVAVTEFDNRGSVGATRNATISAGDAIKTLAVVNRGTIQSDGVATLAGAAGGRNLTLDNQAGAGIATKGSLSVTGTQVSNAGVIQSGDALALTVSGSLSNAASGQVLGQGLGSIVNVDAATLDNAGVIQSKGALTAKTTGALSQASTGAIQTLGIDQAGSGWSLALDTQSLNNMGMVSGGGALTATSATSIDNVGTMQSKGAMSLSATTTLTQTDTGKILSEAEASVNTAALGNAGTIQSKGALAVSATTTLTQTDTGRILSDAGASVKTSALTNAGIVQSKGALALSAATTLTQTNTGKILSDDSASVTAVTLGNAGTIQSKGALALAATTLTQTDTGKILSEDSASVATATLDNAGIIQSLGAMGLSATTKLTQTKTGSILSGTGASVTTDILDNAGTIQSLGAMALSATTKLTQTNTGKILSDDSVSVVTASLDNAGRIQAGKSLSVGSSTGRTQLDNRMDGVVVADSLDAWVTNFVNAGTVQTNAGTRIDASKQISNELGATLIAGLAGSSSSLLSAGTAIVNAGTVNTVGQLSMNAVDVTNTSAISVKGILSVTAGQSFVNSGNMRSEAKFNLDANSVNNTGQIAGATALALNVTQGITNSGTLHGATNTVQSRTLSNQGDIKAVSTLDITATDSLNNSGKLISDSSIKLHTASLTNAASGKVIAATTLTGNSVSGVMTLQNAGTLQSGTDMLLGSTMQRVLLANQANGKLTANGDFTLYGTSVTNAAGARIQWMKNGLIDASDLTNATSTSVIVGALDDSAPHKSEIKLSGTLDNAGAIHSSGDLSINAAGIRNTSTAGMSSLNDLSIIASADSNGGADVLLNEGALYAGRNIALTALLGKVSNAGDEATMDAEGDITIKARDILNQHSIQATNIDLQASNSFVNQPLSTLPVIYIDEASPVSDVENQTVSDSFNCNIFGAACDEFKLHERTLVLRQKLTFDLPAFKPQILASNKLSVSYGDGGGVNRAGILSAKTLKISGSGSFTNEDFHLDEITFAKRRATQIKDSTFGSEDSTDYYPLNELQFNNAPAAGDNGSWGTGGEWNGTVDSYRQERNRATYWTSGAGIFAVTLEFTGGALINRGSPHAVAPVVKGASGATAETATAGGVGGVGNIGGVSRVAFASAASRASSAPLASLGSTKAALGLSLNGIVIKLPTNPNGYFVPSRTSGTKYLIETNPLFQAPSSFLGSDYLAEKLGFNPELTQKRLGDSNYEAYLIRQQLIGQTGRNLLNQKESEADQLQRMMDNAAKGAKGMGLTYGQPLTATQLANLKEDIVWMVEVEVNGEKVLAPVVYLSATTLAAVDLGGTTMMAENTTIDAASVTNTGGTLGGTDSLAIKSKGDITNTSGTITGGNVSLTSTEGSVVNQTLATTAGDRLSADTNIGKTAGIVATGALDIDANKDVKVIGANVTAQSAAIAAGGNVTVDTIVDKTTRSEGRSSSGFMSSSSFNQTVSTEKNIGSQLNIGGDLALKSGGDTTIAGSTVNVGGNLGVDAGGDFNVLARQDKQETTTRTSSSGLGVGGGLTGQTATTTNNFKGTNAGSTIEVGGNANIKSEGTMTVQGSDVNVGGNAAVNAKEGIAILDGLNEERTTTRTETTTFLKVGGNSAAEATASAKQAGSASSADASASASAGGSLKLAETTVTNTLSGSKTSVASSFKSGGSMDLQTGGTMTVQGSDVSAGGDLSIDAKRVEVLAGRNETYSSADSKSDSIGIYSDASAGASAGVTGTKSANANAQADTTTTIGMRSETASFSEGSTTNRGSTLSGGGNVTIKAKEDATFVGADVKAGGDISVDAKDINVLAAQDTTYSNSASDTKTAGVYIGGSASASASHDKSSNSAEAGAEVSAGLRYAQESATDASGSVTQRTSTFTAGGDINRKASNTITDQGTQLEAGKNINQSAREIKEIAASDSSWSSSDASSLDARVGVYAGAEASGGSSTGAAPSTDASAGLKASVAASTSSDSESQSTAVTTRYKAGGNINSTSTEKTTLIGSKMEAGGDVNISAGSLDYQAARDTSSSSSKSISGEAEVKVGLAGTAGVNGSVEVEGGTSSSSSNTANAGSIGAGGKINIVTKGDATFEGTTLSAGDGVGVKAGGDVNFNAATSTERSSSVDASFSASAGTSGSGADREKEGAIGGSLQAKKSSSTTAQGSTISAGAGGVTISSGGNTTLEGTQVRTTGAAAVTAGGQVNQLEAKSSSYSVGVDASMSAGAASGDGGTSTSRSELGVEGTRSSTSQGVGIDAGGGTQVISNAPASVLAAPSRSAR